MLGKLIKYETKATARVFLPLYSVLLLFALINRIIDPFRTIPDSNKMSFGKILSGFILAVYIVLIIGTAIMTIVIMIQRFYKNLLGDEGYLMFTLPVETWKHIVSKLLIAILWIVLSILAALCSVIIISGISMSELMDGFVNTIEIIKGQIGTVGLYLAPFYIFVMTVLVIITIYAAIALGHLFPKHKLVTSFAMYAVIYFVNQLISVLYIMVFRNMFFKALFTPALISPHTVQIIISALIVLEALLAVGYFVLTNIILSKKLNLE